MGLGPQARRAIAGLSARTSRTHIVISLGFIAVVLPLFLQKSSIYLLSLVFVFAILAFTAIIPIGYSGQLILSQGAFFGIGAYTYVKVVQAGVPTWGSIPVAVVIAAIISVILGLPAIRARGIYLGIITLAFNEIFVISLDLFPTFFGGSKGLPTVGLAFPGAVGRVVESEVPYYYLALLAFVGTFYLVHRVLNSEIGWAFLAINEDQTTAESIGIDTRRYRLVSFALTGTIGGFAGAIYAPLNGYISPTMFNLQTTIDIILSAVAGGVGVPVGSILGASVVVLLPELLRGFANFRFIVYGLLLILILMFLPRGFGGWLKQFLD